jgi:hypothetical protein
MRLMFVHYVQEDRGSPQDLYNYARVAQALHHEVAIYGPSNPMSPFNYSVDIASADAIIFIFEWTTDLQYGDNLDLARLVGKVPRDRRVVIDCDGKYNDAISVIGDYNHRDEATSRRWLEICDSLSDKICQPTLHPLRPNVRPFLFYAYNPAWAVPLNFSAKEYGMLYVGHSKFRWHAMRRVLQAIQKIRPEMGRIGLVGHGWRAVPDWATQMQIEEIYFSDPAYLRELDVEIIPPVPFGHVINRMSTAVFNPVLLRPTFNYLRLVNPRMFETPAASTIPLFALDEVHVREIYGECSIELTLPDDPSEKILDIMRRPEHYADVVSGIREHLAKKHSHAARLRELIEVVES